MKRINISIEQAKEEIFNFYSNTEIYHTPFRFVLEIYHRLLYKRVDLISPSLELGISNGVASSFIFSGRGKIDWGTDMPNEGLYKTNTIESHGAVVRPEAEHYVSVLGADGQNIPFPDNSFATVICNEVLGQGMDRFKMISEMTRVLAPGGSIALTENTDELTKYPHLLKRIEKFNPFRGRTVSEQWYHDKFEILGLEHLSMRQFMNSSLGVNLMYLLFSAKLEAPPVDSEEGSLYKVYLESFLPLIEQEMSCDLGISNGMHLFAMAKKPGHLTDDLRSPEPCCPECYGKPYDINKDLWKCLSDGCGATFMIKNKVPLLVTSQSFATEETC